MTTPFDFSSKFFSELRPDTPGLVAPDIKTIKSALPLEITTSYFADFIGYTRPKRSLCRELIPTGSVTVQDGPYVKEPNASYVARQTLRLRLRRKWLNYITETGFEMTLGRWPVHKERWFGVSRTDRGGGSSPIKEQEVRISADEEAVIVVAGDALRIFFAACEW
ncbi:hypothetical protein CNMCM6457_008615 [Aspergillus fumigatiaffinis]|nr:hypothetical protein CNMCM6457_008615 [Aspergillus fumigatiaffinis]